MIYLVGNRSGGIRTHPGWILSPLPLPLGYTPVVYDSIIAAAQGTVKC
jgi:hypothetical protein